MPSREVSRIGGLDLCQAKAKTKARHRAIGELSIGRSFKRSEYFQHLSWTDPSAVERRDPFAPWLAWPPQLPCWAAQLGAGARPKVSWRSA